MHGIGVTEALAALPRWVVAVFALVTQLGDPVVVFAGVTLLYWLADDRFASRPRRAGALLVAAGLCALAATVGLKSLFAVHRPAGAGSATAPLWLPEALAPTYVGMATGDGFGFPSGHAIGSTAIYVGVAVLYDRLGDRRRRYRAAAVVVSLVALSRLVLGVHTLPDVVAGVLVGLAVVGAVLRLRDRPERAFLLASGLSVLALLAAWHGGHTAELYEAALGVGSALGGALAWPAFDERERPRPAVAAAGVVVLGGLWAAVYATQPTLLGTVLGSAVAVGGIVALPGLVARVHGAAAERGAGT